MTTFRLKSKLVDGLEIGVRSSNLQYFSVYSLTHSLEGNETLFSKALHYYQCAQKVKFEDRIPLTLYSLGTLGEIKSWKFKEESHEEISRAIYCR